MATAFINFGCKIRPFDFMVQFWGEWYRNHFVDFCLPSLFAPNNLPLLNAREGHRFLIATTRDDWQAITALPIMDRLRQHAIPKWIEIAPPANTTAGGARDQYNLNLDHMRLCLRTLFEAAHAAGSYGCSLLPDVIVSDGMVAAMLRSARAGNHLMLCSSLRQAEEGVLEDLAKQGLLVRSERLSMTARDLTLSPRRAADIWARHLHPEMASFEEGSRDPHPAPPFCIWRVPGGRGVIMHSSFAVPILMDFSIVPTNHTACLDRDTFENIYLTSNFSHCDGIDVVRDSDEFVMLSLTPIQVNWSPAAKTKRGTGGILTEYKRIMSIRRAFKTYAGGNNDWLKHEIFRTPFRWHIGEIDDVWKNEERRIERQIRWAVGDYLSAPGSRLQTSLSPQRMLLDIPEEAALRWIRLLSEICKRLLRAISGDPEMRRWVRDRIHARWQRLVGR